MLKKHDICSRIMRTRLKFLSLARSFAFCLFAYGYHTTCQCTPVHTPSNNLSDTKMRRVSARGA